MSSCSGARSNRLKRERLHIKQDGKCFYCRHLIGVYVGELGGPVLEHHTPESRGGGRRHLVLACTSCDKAKGMMHGNDFMALIHAVTTDFPLSMKHRIDVYGRAKAANRILQLEHCKKLLTEQSVPSI